MNLLFANGTPARVPAARLRAQIAIGGIGGDGEIEPYEVVAIIGKTSLIGRYLMDEHKSALNCARPLVLAVVRPRP